MYELYIYCRVQRGESGIHFHNKMSAIKSYKNRGGGEGQREGRRLGWNIIIQAHCLPFNLLATSYTPSRIYVGYRNNMSQHSISPPLSQIYFAKQHALCAEYISTPSPSFIPSKWNYMKLLTPTLTGTIIRDILQFYQKRNIIVLWNTFGFIHGSI